MGFRFYRRIRLIPGLRINLSRSGTSLSIGHRGTWYTVGPRGRRVTLGIPGSGLFWTQRLPAAGAPLNALPAPPKTGFYRIEKIPPAAAIHDGHRAAFVVVVVVVVAVVAIGLLILGAAHG